MFSLVDDEQCSTAGKMHAACRPAYASTQLDHGRTKEGPKKIELVASYQDGRESNMARENAMR